MATWEKQLLDTELTPVEYVRFVDDIWGIWTHGEEALIMFQSWIANDPSFLHADSEDADQIRRMLRLIWVFSGRTCHFVWFCHKASPLKNSWRVPLSIIWLLMLINLPKLKEPSPLPYITRHLLRNTPMRFLLYMFIIWRRCYSVANVML